MEKKNKRIVMSEIDKEFLSKLDQKINVVTIDKKEYALKDLLSTDGKKSVVWKVSDKYGNNFALKLATFGDYVDRSFDEEIIRASKVNTYSQFARIEGAELKHFEREPGKVVKCVAFLEEWVDGISLDKIDNEKVTISFVLNYIEKFCDILSILKHLKLRHDDLHTGNVMIVKPQVGSLKKNLEVKIIDLGSIKDYYSTLKPIKNGVDDTVNFAIQIKYLLNKILFLNDGERRILSSKEMLFIDGSRRILNSIVDTDKGRALTKPFLINRAFQTLNTQIFAPKTKNLSKLSDPFDYISAEQINDDKLLIKLFAESCPWIANITSPNPVLLTGPRGCGKSMLFRRFSLKALLAVDDKLINDIGIAGFYISCSADLSNRYSIINTQAQAAEYKNEIIHYFNLVLLKEIISTLKTVCDRDDSFEMFGVNESIEREIFDYITSSIKISQERKLSLQGVKPIVHLLELIKIEITNTYIAIVRRNKIGDFTTFSFISDVTKFLCDKIQYFKSRKITFLIDDYSVHRIPEHVQSLLNMVIWDRQSSHIFKVSSEKYGTVRYMYNNTSADLSREYTEIDIGRSYINLSESSKDLKKFSAELLNHRLRLAEYKGTAEKLIGKSNYIEGSLGKQIYKAVNPREFYHGLDTLSQVCSGDISTLLEIYRTIFTDANVKSTTTEPIPKNKQHSAITTASRNFLELTKTFHPLGNDMYKIVLNFGGLCKKILTDSKPQSEKTGKLVPNETSRIEIEETEFQEEFTPHNESIYKELIRRAIFIEMEPSRGRHTLGITNRLQLRRIYCPSFGISLSKTTAIKWSQSEFKAFLNDPESKCEHEFIARWKKNESTPNHQNELF